MKMVFPLLISLLFSSYVESQELMSGKSSGRQDSASVSGVYFPEATPQSQGVHPASSDRLREMILGFIDAQEIVGAEIVVIKNRRTIMHEALGVDDPASSIPLELDRIYSIRSMTKPLAGALAQILIDENVIDSDDAVSQYVESFAAASSKPITIEHLLTHRSGLPMRSPGRLWSDYSSYNSVLQIADYWSSFEPRIGEPGEAYHYADANVDTLGAVIEKATGQPAEQLIQSRILEPLEMSDTIALLKPDDPRVKRVAGKNGGGRGRWKQFWRWQGQPYFSFPMFAQGYYSTPTDYAKFLAMIMDGGIFEGRRVLSEAAVARILTPVSRTPMPTGFVNLKASYGQLMHLYDQDGKVVVFGHSGSDGTYAWAWPEEDLMVLYFTQSRGNITMNRIEAVIDSLLARPIVNPR